MADEGQSVAGEDIVDDIVEFTGIEPEPETAGLRGSVRSTMVMPRLPAWAR